MRHFTTLAAVLIAGTLLAGLPAFGQKAPKVKSKSEGEAVNAMLTAQDPDARIKAADALIGKFADTEYKSIALFTEADAYQQKGDNDKAIVFGEQSLDADPTNFQPAVLLAKTYAATTKNNDLDKEEKLSKASKYANQAIEILKTAPKPNPGLTDAQWTGYKNDFAGQCYFALGVAAIYHNKMDEVTADFDKVATMDTDPVDLIRGARLLIELKKPEAAIVWLDKAAVAANANAQIKDIALKDKARAESMIKK